MTGGAPISVDYTDATGDELADGLFASGSGDLTDTNSMALYDPAGETQYSEFVFDLSEATDLDSVWIDYLNADAKWGVNSPVSAELAFSTDGVTFTDVTAVDDFVTEGSAYFTESRVIADLTDVTAQYVRMRVDMNGTFAFLTEVSFVEELDMPTLLDGDANSDGTVNALDVSLLASNWQQSGKSWGEGDFNGDGTVNALDVSLLASNWQMSIEEEAAAVPEPSTLILLAGLLLGFGFLRRR